jgi:hypothetical protein
MFSTKYAQLYFTVCTHVRDATFLKTALARRVGRCGSFAPPPLALPPMSDVDSVGVGDGESFRCGISARRLMDPAVPGGDPVAAP